MHLPVSLGHGPLGMRLGGAPPDSQDSGPDVSEGPVSELLGLLAKHPKLCSEVQCLVADNPPQETRDTHVSCARILGMAKRQVRSGDLSRALLQAQRRPGAHVVDVPATLGGPSPLR